VIQPAQKHQLLMDIFLEPLEDRETKEIIRDLYAQARIEFFVDCHEEVRVRLVESTGSVN
jgi:hypothetical protein